MEPRIIILLGRSGSGKGTQAKLLQEKFGLEYVGSGDLLRNRKKENDFTGRKIGEVIDRGKFAPTAIIFKLWIDKWEELKAAAGFRGFIIDGSPRKLIEVELIDQALEWYEWNKYLRVILIDLSREEAFNRLSKRRICKDCGRLIPFVAEFKSLLKCDKCHGDLISREDDTPEGINSRQDEFEKNTFPVIESYEKSGRLMRVNGEQSIEEAHKDIIKAFSLNKLKPLL